MKITVLGAGSWGTTLACLLADKGYEIAMWEYNKEQAERLKNDKENKIFLPGVPLPDNMQIDNNMANLIKGCDLILFAIPSQIVRSVAEQLAPLDFGSPLIVNVAKGIENKTLLRMSQVLMEILPERVHQQIVALSGPSHAEEVSHKIPTTVVSGSLYEDKAKKVQEIFITSYFRVYTNTDLIGVELGGSLKNVIAIAAGICDGLGLGDNTKGALLTRGLAEIVRLGVRMGANPRTFAGLSGMGDLITTCISKHSRNRYVGDELGQGRTLSDILSNMIMVAEGVKTTQSAYALSKKYQVEMPITEKMWEVLFENRPTKQAVYELMGREAKAEIWE